MITKHLLLSIRAIRILLATTVIAFVCFIIINYTNPTLNAAHVFDSYIITFLIVVIAEMLCYYYLDKIKSKIDNEAFNNDLQQKYNRLQKEHDVLQEENRKANRRYKYLEHKLDREMSKIEVLTHLIERTFNQVLNDSRYGKK